MRDDLAIEALSCAYDRQMSAQGPFGGMYDFTDYRAEIARLDREAMEYGDDEGH